jgi:hypothetical protein
MRIVLCVSLELFVDFAEVLLEVERPDSKERIHIPHLSNHICCSIRKSPFESHHVGFVNLILVWFSIVNFGPVLKPPCEVFPHEGGIGKTLQRSIHVTSVAQVVQSLCSHVMTLFVLIVYRPLTTLQLGLDEHY